MDIKFCIHHVGGRNGTIAFPNHPKFSQDIIQVLYEADASCVKQIKDYWNERNQETIVLPYCIGARREKKPFHILFNHYESSLLKPNPAYNEFYLPYPESGEVDHLTSENTKIVEEIEVEVTPLDEVISRGNIPSPNFFSVDTQGTTLDVLMGAEKALQKSVVGMVLETGLHPFYIGEVLFGDICKWVSERGFLFFKFLHVGQRSPFRCPLGFRGDGVDYYAESLFLRKVESVIDSNIPSEEKYVLLHKLAFTAIVYCQIEYAIKALLAARSLEVNDRIKEDVAKHVYGRMGRDILKAYDSQPHIYPATNNKEMK
jgi:FkbM family methyltransferase